MVTNRLKIVFASLFLATVCLIAMFILSSCNDNDATAQKDPFTVIFPDNWDSEPELIFNDPDYRVPVEVIDETNGVAKQVVKVIDKGDGAPIESGLSVEIQYINYSMPSNDRYISTWEGNVPNTKLTVFSGDETPNSLSQVLIGLNEGAVVVILTPGWTDDSSAVDITGTNYSAQLLHIKSVRNPVLRANGEDVPKDKLRQDLPTVTLSENGTPSIKIPASFVLPDQTVSQQLKIGKGDVIQDSDTVSFAYSAFKLDGDIIQSTWKDRVPLVVSISSLNTAWKDTVVGSTVGSQFLIIAKPDDTSNIDESVIYVVDVLEKN